MWYSQNDPRWAGQRLGTYDNTVTIGTDGCYVTAFANMANDCGKDITPAQLDDIFTDQNFYAEQRLCFDNMLSWVYPDIVYQESRSFPSDADLSYLNNDVHVKQILMIDADNNPANGVNTHFMYFYDYSPLTGVVRVIDSWTGLLVSVSDVYGDPVKVIYKVVTYTWNPPEQVVQTPPPPEPEAVIIPPPHIETPVAPVPTVPPPLTVPDLPIIVKPVKPTPSKPVVTKPKENKVNNVFAQIRKEGSDIAFRAGKTFVQSFAAVILATNQPLTKQALVAAIAAGISAVWNSLKAVKNS